MADNIDAQSTTTAADVMGATAAQGNNATNLVTADIANNSWFIMTLTYRASQ
jgi:hypothetical protein